MVLATGGLLVDFAGTLFLPLDGQRWSRAAARQIGFDLSAPDSTELASLLDSRFSQVRAPGRDLSPAAHRQSMLPTLESLVTDRRLAVSLYEFQFKHQFWQLRDGVRDLLHAARQRKARVAVVSNVPWDIRPLFEGAGLTSYVHGFALSFEVGAEKPDEAIFRYALDLTGCTPATP